jgi:hypothetical protein
MAFKRSPVRSRSAPQVFFDSGNQLGVVASWLLATSARRSALIEGDAPYRRRVYLIFIKRCRMTLEPRMVPPLPSKAKLCGTPGDRASLLAQ